MEKIKKTIRGIAEIIKNPWLLNIILNDDSVWQRQIVERYNLPNGLPVVDINDLCENKTLEETLNCFAFLGGGSLPTDIALLKILAKKFESCTYFEIGTWRGESVVNVADIAQECYTLNLSKEEILALGLSEKYADLHGFFSKAKDNIIHLTGNSKTFDYKGLGKKFDLIFIDGDHHYDFVKNDTEKVFEHLVHDKSIIVWHDYARSPENLRPEILAGILDGTPKEFHQNLYHVSNTMCAIFIRENLNTSTFSNPIRPDKTFKVRLESQKI